LKILDLYAQVYQDVLAVPVIKGKKTEKEKFAGGYYTTTVEAFLPDTGRGIQGATSHCLGQNFAKMFNIDFEDEKGEKKLVWQNSWGLTTRTIGVMVMVHGDDKGLVLPPRVAPVQVVIVPIFFKETEELNKKAEQLKEQLKTLGVRVEVDSRQNYTPGWKYNYWEMKGVPLRIELGPKDMKAEQVVVVRRDDSSQKITVSWAEMGKKVPALLRTVQNDMFKRAQAKARDCVKTALDFDQFMKALDVGGMALAPWCGEKNCEESLKTRSGEASKEAAASEPVEDDDTGALKQSGAAKSLCIPFEQPPISASHKCVGCKGKPTMWCLFGRSY